MSLEDGDIIRITTKAHFIANNAPIFNVFWFQVSDLTGVISTAEDLTQACGDAFITLTNPMRDVQSNQVAYDNGVLDNMTNLIDQATYTPASPIFGTQLTVAEPSGVALSFKLVRSNRTTRNGSKRVGGVADGLVTDTTGANLNGNPFIVAIEQAFAEPIDIVVGGGASCVFNPVIVRRPAVGLPVSIYQPVQDCVFRGLGSQDTRKRLL